MIPWRVHTLNRISDLLMNEMASRILEPSSVLISEWEEHVLEKDGHPDD